MRPQKRYELISINVPAGNTALRIPIPDIPQLRSDVTQDVIIRGLETYSVESMPADFNGLPLLTNAQLLKCFLTLYIQQEQSVNFLPMVKLLNTFNALNTTAYFFTDEINQFENLMVDWTKSFFTLSSSLANAGQVQIMLGVTYQRLPGGTIAKLQKQMNPANASQYQGDWYAGNS